APAILMNLLPALAFAQDGAAADGSGRGLIGLATAVCMSLAAFGGAFAQGKASAAALEGIARNPQAQKQIFTPMIISLALVESLVIYAFVIAFFLLGKI